MALVKEGTIFLNLGECGWMSAGQGEHYRGVYIEFCLFQSSWTAVEASEGYLLSMDTT